jgi:3-phenylpropionate/trans-cinnamate dioxygenase ferredoxin subunit
VHDVKPGEAKRFDTDVGAISLVRIDDDWYAIGDVCTHQNISLSEGEVHEDTREIECWKHGSCFSLETGEPSSLPATKAEPIYAVHVDGDDVWITT